MKKENDSKDLFSLNNLMDSLHSEFELRQSPFLNVLFHNIDLLIYNSDKWFKDDVPPEFSEVINSLVHLSALCLEKIDSFIEYSSDNPRNSFIPDDIIRSVAGSFREISKVTSFSLDSKGDTSINVSPVLFKDALVNLFLVVFPYITGKTDVKVAIKGGVSEVDISFAFCGILPDMPDLGKMMKLFYTVKHKDSFRILAGFSLPVENFRRIGGITKIEREEDDLLISIKFSSSGFIETVENIRKDYSKSEDPQKEGNVYVCISDRVAEMFLHDNLSDIGYNVVPAKPETVTALGLMPQDRALIIDANYLVTAFESPEKFFASISFSKIIIITKSGDRSDYIIPDHAVIIKYPFEIDQISSFIG
ncbi:MAG TPA: hypothetical protein PLH15_08090 [Spirochaetota bacterium]|nr:hypothetical protein [Spirochaetota bacterium]HQQ23784.1 hypothetical protein [Spirochaetota bacterium]